MFFASKPKLLTTRFASLAETPVALAQNSSALALSCTLPIFAYGDGSTEAAFLSATVAGCTALDSSFVATSSSVACGTSEVVADSVSTFLSSDFASFTEACSVV